MRTESDLEQALDQLLTRTPQGATFVTDLRRRQRRRSRGFAIGGLALVGAVLAVVVAVLGPGSVRHVTVPVATPAPSISERPSTDGSGGELPPDRGAWSRRYRVDPPAGWHVTMVYGTSTSESTKLVSTDDLNGPGCDVSFSTADEPGPTLSSSLTTTVAGVRGQLSPGETGDSAEFWWVHRRGAWASVSCVGMKDPTTAIARVLKRITVERNPFRVPFTLSPLPSKFRLVSASQGFAPGYLSGVELGDDRREPGLHGASVEATSQRLESSPGARIEQLTVAGRPAVFVVPQPFTGAARLCLTGDTASVRLCASTTSTRLRAGTPDTVAQVRDRLMIIMSLVRPAPDLTDSRTWPSAGRLPS